MPEGPNDPRINQNGQHVYVAGPFFNPSQIAVVDLMTKVLGEQGLPTFSPKDDGGILKPKASAEDRQAIVDENREAIIASLFILAMLDYPQESKDRELRLVQPTTMRGFLSVKQKRIDAHLGVMASGPLQLTDTGTAWEMGFASCASIPVVGYVHDRKVKSLNVMLADTTEGVIVGPQALRAWVKTFAGITADPMFDWDALSPWKGKIR